MTTERKTLPWLAFIGSLALCLPCACLSGFFTVLGVGALTIPGFSDNQPTEDAFFTGLFAVITIIALIPGIVLLVWGVRHLRQNAANN